MKSVFFSVCLEVRKGWLPGDEHWTGQMVLQSLAMGPGQSDLQLRLARETPGIELMEQSLILERRKGYEAHLV